MTSSNNLEMRSLTRSTKALVLFCFAITTLGCEAASALAQTSPAKQAPTANKPSPSPSQAQAQTKPDSTYQPITLGGVGRPSGGKKSLGTLFDVSADFNVTQTTVLTFYASGVRGGGVQGFIYPSGGDSHSARFVYFELSQRF